jgi:hypothetical protein
MDLQGIEAEWYDGTYSPEVYARIVNERHQGVRLSRVTSGGALCPWLANISGGRIPMINNQTSQHIPLINPAPALHMSGVEQDWADAVVDARIDATSEVIVLKRLAKYKIIPGVVPTSNTEYVVWREMANGKIGITEVPYMLSNHAFAASVLTRTPVFNNLNHGDVLRKDEVLAHGSSRTKDGNYAYGKDFNWCWLGRYTTNEDAIEVSRRLVEETKSIKHDTVSFWIFGDDILMNVHGSANDVRPLPMVGDVIGDKGIVAALRKSIRAFSLINQRKANLITPNRPFDKAFTTIAGSRVVEVKVLRNGRGDFKYLTSPVTRYLDSLADSTLQLYKDILDIDSAERRAAGYNYPRHLSWHCMVVQAEAELIGAGIKSAVVSHKVPSSLRSRESIPTCKPTIGDKPYSYHVTITLSKVHTPELGDKYTNRHASKAVIGKITDNDKMPTDVWGRHADVIANPAGVSNRNNPGQTYEAYSNDTCYHAMAKLKKLTSKQDQWNFLFDLYQTTSIETAHTAYTQCTTDAAKFAHVEAVLRDGFIPLISEVGDPTLGIHGVELIKRSPHRPPKDKVMVTNLDGSVKQTKMAVRIAPIYTFALDKIGKYANATNVATRQSLGFVSKATAKDKALTHISHNSNRHMGFTEVRSLAANANPEDAAYTLACGNSQKVMEIRVDRQLDGIGLGEPLSKAEIGSGRGLELLGHEFAAFGHELTRGGDDE